MPRKTSLRNIETYTFSILTAMCLYLIYLKVIHHDHPLRGRKSGRESTLALEEWQFKAAMEKKYKATASVYENRARHQRPRGALEIENQQFLEAINIHKTLKPSKLSSEKVKSTNSKTPEPKENVKVPKSSEKLEKSNNPEPKHPLLKTPIINNKNLCKDQRVDVLIYVQSYWKNFDNRKVLRETWLDKKYLKNKTIKTVFILGKPPSNEDQKKISIENAMYLDIVQGNFVDSFQNLTMKSILAFQWIKECCIHARHILKVDDDVFVNMFLLYENLIPKISKMERTVMCHVKLNNTSRIFRNPASKWYVPKHIFPKLTRFPTFCSGYFALITTDLVPLVYERTVKAPYFGVDDVYLFGLVMGQVQGMKYIDIQKSMTLNQQAGLKAYERGKSSSPPIVVNAWEKDVLLKIWKLSISEYSEKR